MIKLHIVMMLQGNNHNVPLTMVKCDDHDVLVVSMMDIVTLLHCENHMFLC